MLALALLAPVPISLLVPAFDGMEEGIYSAATYFRFGTKLGHNFSTWIEGKNPKLPLGSAVFIYASHPYDEVRPYTGPYKPLFYPGCVSCTAEFLEFWPIHKSPPANYIHTAHDDVIDYDGYWVVRKLEMLKAPEPMFKFKRADGRKAPPVPVRGPMLIRDRTVNP